MKHKNIIKLICLSAAFMLPVIPVLCGFAFLPEAYGETFLGALADKYGRLEEISDPKIVIIGGSSVAFGIDSAVIEEKTGYKVVNFGLYATLGTKIMLDLSEDSLNAGDIVILAPELDAQTLSMYFNGTAAWQALESDLSMLRRVGRDDFGELLARLPGYLSDRMAARKGKISPDGVYRRDSFNGYGDISYPRPYNIMTMQYDPTQIIDLKPSLFDGEFTDYLNRYIDRAEHRGVSVYFSYCPMNASALSYDTDEESVARFHEFVAETLHCDVISDPNRSIMDKGYFFDTNFHLNDAGVRVHTAYLCADILRTLGKTDRVILDLPEPPGRKPSSDPGTDPAVGDGWEKYFVAEKFGDVMRITGTTADAEYMTELTLPEYYDGVPVRIVGSGAFAGCKKLEEVVIGNNISLLEDGIFSGCKTLKIMSLLHEDANDIECGRLLFDGAPENVKIVLHSDAAYSNFTVGYKWGIYAERMVKG